MYRGAKSWSRRSDFFHGGGRERVNKFSVTSRRTVGRVFSEWLVFHDAIWRWTDGHEEREGWRIVWLNLRKGTWDWPGERERRHEWWNLFTHSMKYVTDYNCICVAFEWDRSQSEWAKLFFFARLLLIA